MSMFQSYNKRVEKFNNFAEKTNGIKCSITFKVLASLKKVIEENKDYQNYLAKTFTGNSICIMKLDDHNTYYKESNINFEIFYDAIEALKTPLDGLALMSLFSHRTYLEDSTYFEKGMFKYLRLITVKDTRSVRFEIVTDLEALVLHFENITCDYALKGLDVIVKFTYKFKDYEQFTELDEVIEFFSQFRCKENRDRAYDYLDSFTDKKPLNKFNALIQQFVVQ